MKNSKGFGLASFMLLFWGICGSGCSSPNASVPTVNLSDATATLRSATVRNPIGATRVDPVEERLRAMTLEERAGQMLMIGFSGLALSKDSRRLLRECKVGGVILFKNNISRLGQLQKLNQDVQRTATKASGIPAFIATDQEGGRVARLKQNVGMPVFAANGKLARSGKISEIKAAARITGRRLRTAGINMNLAPVLDVVTTKNRRGIIGDRSFGSNPQIVARWGSEYIRALQNENIIATAKHFPGHGATTTDSHLSLPIVKLSPSELRRTHIAPFRVSIQNGVGAVMPAHIVYGSLDKKNPATLSRPILHDLLRRELGFKGLVISDSMSMAAISKNRNWERTVVQATRSGVDVLLLTNSPSHQRRAFRALVNAARRDPQIKARITQSCRRILQTKQRFGIWKPKLNPR